MPDAMVNRGIRLPLDMLRQIESAGHPHGLSGLVRDAVTEYFARHPGGETTQDDIQLALRTITKAVEEMK